MNTLKNYYEEHDGGEQKLLRLAIIITCDSVKWKDTLWLCSLAQHEKYLKRMIYIVTSLSTVNVLDTIMIFILVFPGKQWWLDSGVFLPLWLFLQQFTGSLGLPSTWLDERTGLDLEIKLFDFCGCLWNNTKIQYNDGCLCNSLLDSFWN